MTRSPAFARVYPALVLFTAFTGDFWRYLVGWLGFGALVVVLTAIGILLLVRSRDRWRWEWLPFPLVGFLALATLSIAWSQYRSATAIGVLSTWMTVAVAVALAIAFSWAEILRALATAMRFLLGLSFLFEFVVSAFIKHPILPLVPPPGVDYSTYETIPKLMYWSRDLLFEGGKIQGIVGNSSLLAFAALIGLITFSVQFAARSAHRGWSAVWILVAASTIVLTRSPTVYVALLVIVGALVVVLLLRHTTGVVKAVVYAAATAAVAAAVAVASFASEQLLALVGKSADLTGRVDIWNAVIELAAQRPVAGWGWVSFWVPWVAPFDNLAFAGGVRQLHAHNAWIDIYLQLGILGLIVFGALALSTGVRAWQIAISSEKREPGVPGGFRTITLLPLLLLLALLVHSVAESRLLVEYGLVMLALIAVKTKDATN